MSYILALSLQKNEIGLERRGAEWGILNFALCIFVEKIEENCKKKLRSEIAQNVTNLKRSYISARFAKNDILASK